MADDLRTRIVAVLEANFDDTAPSLSMVDMADAVIRELDAGYILVPRSHTVARWIPEGIFDERT